MASDEDKAHMRAIAAKMAELNQDAVRESAGAGAEQNLLASFELSRFALAINSTNEKPTPVAPIELWRRILERRAQR